MILGGSAGRGRQSFYCAGRHGPWRQPQICEIVKLGTVFTNDTPEIFCVWTADAPQGIEARAAWIAEDVGKVAEPNHRITEASEAVGAVFKGGVHFSLTKLRPTDGRSESTGSWIPLPRWRQVRQVPAVHGQGQIDEPLHHLSD